MGNRASPIPTFWPIVRCAARRPFLNICDGLLRVEPGCGQRQPDGSLCLEIDLSATAHRFLVGHRIRLQVSSGAHPRVSRNLGTGEPVLTSTRMVSADQTIFHDAAHPLRWNCPYYLIEISPAQKNRRFPRSFEFVLEDFPMTVQTDVIQFPTKGHSDILDITNEVVMSVQQAGLRNGTVTIFRPRQRAA